MNQMIAREWLSILDMEKVSSIFDTYRPMLNEFFEDRFIENDFSSLFPSEGYGEILKKIFEEKAKNGEEIPEVHQALLLYSCAEAITEIPNIIETLPIFKMFEAYKKHLNWCCFTNDGYVKERFDTNPFQDTFAAIHDSVVKFNGIGLSQKFLQTYFAIGNVTSKPYSWREAYLWSEQFYGFTGDAKNSEALQAKNWFKLAYHCMEKELFRNCIFTKNENIRLYSQDLENGYSMKKKVYAKDKWTQGIVYEMFGVTYE